VATLRIKAFDVVSDLLIWVAFLAGIIGAFALSATKMGAGIGHIFGILPAWVVLPATLIGLAMVIYDLKDDGIPNRLRTMYIAVLWPSALLGVDGPLAGFANGWIHDMDDWIFNKIGPAIDDNPKHTGTATIMATIAVTCIAFALYTAHRYYASHRRGGTTTTPTVATGTPTISANRKKR
jgi:hypothetical protein